ncbi:nitrous oxide reductase accessory protein NosL [Polycladidibacter hongkongensis]|uniref:nitrous oxide reductase accessory protein NosL n=1 Tax=Polycladidibacter hongkongensis TaxID=1647556 RepID=UPI001FCC09D2|nr:nitrous oxide reductase accessory protein NosL [Pseudovibrio hongkongensis]
MTLLLALTVAACGGGPQKATSPPAPVALSEEALSFYCQMNVLEHPGPKAQIHLAGAPAPLFFAQVRDAIAFIKSEERPGDVLAIYVSDMGKAPSWDAPGDDNWTLASTAKFVVGAKQSGGMGAPEIVPFSSEDAAQAYAKRKGGKVMALAEIPAQSVLGEVMLFEGEQL